MSGAQVDIAQLQDPQALRKIARFIMEDDAKSITRDSLRGYLSDEYPDLAEAELTKLVKAVHDQINEAFVTIGWPWRREGEQGDPVGLADWLRAQILERRAVAVAAGGGSWAAPTHPIEHLRDDNGDVVVYSEGVPSEQQFAHIALNSPQDTIARCDFESFILDDHKEWGGWAGNRPTCQRCYDGDDPHEGGSAFPCASIRALAAAYKHRPGYKAEEWAFAGDGAEEDE